MKRFSKLLLASMLFFSVMTLNITAEDTNIPPVDGQTEESNVQDTMVDPGEEPNEEPSTNPGTNNPTEEEGINPENSNPEVSNEPSDLDSKQFNEEGYDANKIVACVVKIDETCYETLETAISAATSSTIVLQEDVVVNDSIIIDANKNIVFDLNGKNISVNSSVQKALFKVKNAGLTIKDSVGAGKATGNETAVTVLENGNFTLESGAIEGQWYGVSGNGAGNDNTTIEIKGGSISAVYTNDGTAIYHPQAGVLKISGGTITGSTGIQICGGNATISGGTINATASDLRTNKGTGDGSIIDGAALSIIERAYPNGAPTVTVNGGVFNSANSTAMLVYSWRNDSGTSSAWATAKDNITVIGGDFSQDIDHQLISEGYESTLSNGRYTVAEMNVVAIVGDKKYSSLAKAMEESSGATVVVQKDTTLDTYTVANDKTVNLDLNGKTVDLKATSLVNNGVLTIKDNTATGTTITAYTAGKITSGNNTIINNGTLTIENGVIDATAHGKSAILNNSNGTLTMTNGKLTRSNEAGITGGNGGNSFYVLFNKGTIESISGGFIVANGSFSSLINNLGTSSKTALIKSISGGVFENNFVVLKNDDYSEITTISGGTFTSGVNTVNGSTITNYGKIGTISGGLFVNKGKSTSVLATLTWKDKSNIEFVGSVNSITGGTFLAQGKGSAILIANDGKCSTKPVVNISEANVYGNLNVRGESTLAISGGKYSVSPLNYVVDGKTAFSQTNTIDGITYNFIITPKAADIPVVEVGDEIIEVNTDSGVIPPAGSIDNIAKSTINLDDAILSVANDKTIVKDKEKLIEILGNKFSTMTDAEKANAKIVIETKTIIDVVGYQESDGKKTLNVEITPYYDLYATFALSADSMSDLNSVKITNTSVELKVTTPVELKLPVDLIENANDDSNYLFVQHTKADGKQYIYRTTYENGVVTFTNPNGFSSFAVILDARQGKMFFGSGDTTGAKYDFGNVGQALPTSIEPNSTFKGWKYNGVLYTTFTDELLDLLNTNVEITLTPEFVKNPSTGSSWDDGGPFTTDKNGNIFDRWGNEIYHNPTGTTSKGYKVPNTGVK